MQTLEEDASQALRRDPVADWKAFEPDKIPSKGGSLGEMPRLFVETLESLQGRQIGQDITKAAQKKKLKYPEFLSILFHMYPQPDHHLLIY